MKKTTTMKAFALSLAMALGMLLPTTTNAQNDGFFRGNMDNYENRDAGINSNDGAGISNWGIGEEVPLGSGLLVLAAAGAGYAAMRRKRNKRGVALIIALAMILTMSNCKKNVETISNVTSNGVQITLDVDGGSKVNVNPTGGETFATVDFESGDIIYVGNNGHYCGYLEHNGTYFTGSIDETNLSNDDYLHFYFIGNKGKTSQPSSVSITDQTSKYPVISYAHSKKLYYGAGSYTAKLENYCAIAKFPLSGSGTNNAVYVRGMYNTVTVNFAANNYASSTTGSPYSFSKEGNGTIRLHSENATEKWAILLKQDAVTADLLADGFEATTVSVPAIVSNTYHANDIAAASLTAGSKVCYSFTSDDKGSVIRFSKGNLQYLGTGTSGKETPKWRFADNQWDYMGDGPTSGTANQGNVAIDGYSAYNTGTPTDDDMAAARDLFGWGTSGISGYTPIATCYQPWSTSTNNDDYKPYGSTSMNLYDGGSNKGKADWGYNAISNGGNTQNFGWRTLTSAEWTYLFNTRSNTTVNETKDARFTKAAITTPGSTTVNGLIIFPDSYSGGTPSGVTWGAINGTSNGYTTTCTANGWAALEAAGCVFLPAAGRREGSSVDYADSYGRYWSSTYINSNDANIVNIRANYLNPQSNNPRYRGLSVRLVF